MVLLRVGTDGSLAFIGAADTKHLSWAARRGKKTVLFPIRIDDAVMETDEAWAVKIRGSSHGGDFRRWKDQDAYQRSLRHLLRDLKADAAR